MGAGRQTEDEALVDALLDEALAGMTDGLPAAAVAEVRELLAIELLASPEGQRLLRSIRPDPQVSASGDVAKDPAADDDEGTGGGRAAG